MALKQILKRSSDALAGLFKTADSKTIKTTSKMLGSKATVISGGKVVAKSTASGFSQGVSSTARVGGKVIAGTGIVAIPAAAGIYGLDKFKNTLARQDEYYATKDENKNYSDETDNLKDRIKILEKAKEQGIDTPDYYLEGGSTTPEGAAGKAGLSPIALLIAGVAVVAIGAYAYSNKSRGGKK